MRKIAHSPRRIATGHRLAIRLPDGTLLSVPPMPAGVSREVRVKVFEYVLRRQIGLAQMTAQIADDAADFESDALRGRLASMMNETPYKGSVMAAAA